MSKSRISPAFRSYLLTMHCHPHIPIHPSHRIRPGLIKPLQFSHRQPRPAHSRFIHQLNPLHHSTIMSLTEFLRQILQHRDRTSLIGRVCLKQDGTDQTGIVLTVLRTGKTVEIDKDGEVEFVGPIDGLNEIRVLQQRFVVSGESEIPQCRTL